MCAKKKRKKKKAGKTTVPDLVVRAGDAAAEGEWRRQR